MTRRPVSGMWLFYLYERYSAFRPYIGFRAFTLVYAALHAAGLLVACLVGLGLVGAVHGLLPDADDRVGLSVAALAVLNAYLVAAYFLKEAASTQARQALDSPNRALFRALDLAPITTFTVYTGVRAAYVFLCALAATLAGAAALGAVHGFEAARLWVLLLPVAGLTTTLAVAAWRASRPRANTLARGIGLAAAAGMIAALGYGTGRLIHIVTERGAANVEVAWATSPPTSALAAGGLALALCAGLVVARLRALAGASYDLGSRAGAGSATPRSGWPTVIDSFTARAARELTRSDAAPMVKGSVTTLAFMTLFGFGIVAGGVRADRQAVAAWVVPASNGYLLVTLLILLGLTFSVAGPSAMMPRLRYIWESAQRSSLDIGFRALLPHLALVSAPALLVGGAQAGVLAQPSPRALALAWGLVGAAAVAETVVPSRMRVDGTTTPGPLAPVVILLLIVPLLPFRGGLWAGLAQLSYALVLLGVGVLCLSRRVQRIPSGSLTSPPATTPSASPS